VRRERDRPVSVCVPAFNGAPYVAEAIRSVLEQSFRDFELLVVDDGSTDGTADAVEALRDDRLRVVRNPSRLGLVGNWNRCLQLARGRHLVVFHQDDVMAPDNLHAKLEFLEAHPSVGLVHSDVVQIDVQGRVLSDHWSVPLTPEDEGRHDGRVVFQSLVRGANLVCAPSVMVPRVVFERLGGFDPRLPFTADWEMWLRIALFYDVGYLARPLVRYRRHDAMETLRLPRWDRLEQSYLAKALVLDRYRDRVPDVETLRRQVAGEYRDRALAQARRALEEGRPGVASEYLKVMLAVCRHGSGLDGHGAIADEIVAGLTGPAWAPGWRDALEARALSGEARAARAEAQAAELARALDERDRVIGAMAATRAWRTARRWWWVKDAARRLFGQERSR
jgi:glycosyltransferase involved in cell wall biosynthesis